MPNKDEIIAHITGINKSIKWLMKNELWNEIKQITLDNIVNLTALHLKKGNISIDELKAADFEEKGEYSEEFFKNLEEIMDDKSDNVLHIVKAKDKRE